MASDLSTWLGNKIVRWLANNAMPTAPTSLVLGLFNGDPKSGGSEVTNTIRAAGRVTLALAAAPAAGTGNTLALASDADFGNSAGNATVTHAAVYDNSGNFLCSKAIPGQPYSVTIGSQVKFLAANLSFVIGS